MIKTTAKTLLILAAALFMCAAQADSTINIKGPDLCGTTRMCSDAPTDTGHAVSLGASTLYHSITLVVDGKTYFGNKVTNVNDSEADGVVTASDGTTATVGSKWTHVIRTINSGRAHYQLTVWTLASATVLIP